LKGSILGSPEEDKLAKKYWKRIIPNPKNQKDIDYNSKLCEEFERKLKKLKKEKKVR